MCIRVDIFPARDGLKIRFVEILERFEIFCPDCYVLNFHKSPFSGYLTLSRMWRLRSHFRYLPRSRHLHCNERSDVHVYGGRTPPTRPTKLSKNKLSGSQSILSAGICVTAWPGLKACFRQACCFLRDTNTGIPQ